MKIQEAIDAPETLNGHTVFVEEGIYDENVHLSKSLTLVGEMSETTIIDGGGSAASDYVLLINETSNVIIKGFTFQNCNLGIFLSKCNISRITDNRIRNCNWYGIWVYESSGNLIDNNLLEANSEGVDLCSPALRLTVNNILFSNAFYNNLDVGIRIYWASQNHILGNWITNNPIGLELISGKENSVEANTFQDNEVGVYLTSSTDNRFAHNNLINNTDNVSIDRSFGSSSSDHWDSGYPSGGNHWSNHNGTDYFSGPHQSEAGRDGIADEPYVIDEMNQDRYPLMAPLSAQGSPAGLIERAFQLRMENENLNSILNSLLLSLAELQTDYENLQNASSNINATHQVVLNELDSLRNLTYISAALTAMLAGTTIVLAATLCKRRQRGNSVRV